MLNIDKGASNYWTFSLLRAEVCDGIGEIIHSQSRVLLKKSSPIDEILYAIPKILAFLATET